MSLNARLNEECPAGAILHTTPTHTHTALLTGMRSPGSTASRSPGEMVSAGTSRHPWRKAKRARVGMRSCVWGRGGAGACTSVGASVRVCERVRACVRQAWPALPQRLCSASPPDRPDDHLLTGPCPPLSPALSLPQRSTCLQRRHVCRRPQLGPLFQCTAHQHETWGGCVQEQK